MVWQLEQQNTNAVRPAQARVYRLEDTGYRESFGAETPPASRDFVSRKAKMAVLVLGSDLRRLSGLVWLEVLLDRVLECAEHHSEPSDWTVS
jgi:hypothetical protein